MGIEQIRMNQTQALPPTFQFNGSQMESNLVKAGWPRWPDLVVTHIISCTVLICFARHRKGNPVKKLRGHQKKYYWALVACTSSSTEGATTSSSTACGFPEDFRNSIFRCRKSALTRRFSCRSSKACRPISAIRDKLCDTGAKSWVRYDRLSNGCSLASLSRHNPSHSRACCHSWGVAFPEAIRVAISLNSRAVSLSGGTASSRRLSGVKSVKVRSS